MLEQASLMRDKVKRILLHENHEIRKLVGVGDRRVDRIQHLALSVNIAALRDVQRKHGPSRFRAKESILAHTVEWPLAQEDPHVVRERPRLVQGSVEGFHQLSLPTEINASRYVEISNRHVVLLSVQ